MELVNILLIQKISVFQSKIKQDPKPFIDNPNASATKSSDLLRPRPVKGRAEDPGKKTF